MEIGEANWCLRGTAVKRVRTFSMAVIVMIKLREALNAAFPAVAGLYTALYSFKLATLTPPMAKFKCNALRYL